MAWRSVTQYPPYEGEPVWVLPNGLSGGEERPAVMTDGVLVMGDSGALPVTIWVEVPDQALWRTLLPEHQDVRADDVNLFLFYVDKAQDRQERYEWADSFPYCRVVSPDELDAVLDPNEWWGGRGEFLQLCRTLNELRFMKAEADARREVASETARRVAAVRKEREERERREAVVIKKAEMIIRDKVAQLENEMGFELEGEEGYGIFVSVSFKQARKIVKGYSG